MMGSLGSSSSPGAKTTSLRLQTSKRRGVRSGGGQSAYASVTTSRLAP